MTQRKDALKIREEALKEYKETGCLPDVLEGISRCPFCMDKEKPGCQYCNWCGYIIE